MSRVRSNGDAAAGDVAFAFAAENLEGEVFHIIKDIPSRVTNPLQVKPYTRARVFFFDLKCTIGRRE